MVLDFVTKNIKEYAILFSRNEIDDDIVYLYPIKVLVGKSTSDKQCFYDYYGDELFYPQKMKDENTILIKVKDLYKMFSKSIKMNRKPLDVFFTFKDLIICMDLIDKQFVIMGKNAFESEFGFIPEDKYDQELQEMFSEEQEESIEPKETNENNTLMDHRIDSVIDEIRKTVVSQDDAIKKIVTAVYKNYLFNDPEMKSNILVYGPTGVGKTEIIRQLSNIVKLPVHIEDMTRYTPAGYKGADLDNILAKLYLNAGENLELAQRSILVLDEIDKKASGKDDKDFIKGDVLKSLLKIIEGGVFDIEVPGKGIINFDTSYLTIVAMGAFSDLQTKDIKRNVVGFESKVNQEKEETIKEIGIKEFVEYGLQPEFMGRFNTIVPLNSLKKQDFISILKTSSKSPIKKYKEALNKIGVDVDTLEELYDRVAQKALEKNTGARGLKLVTDEIFNDVLFQIFNEEEKNNFKINYDSLNTKKLLLKRKGN